MRKTKNKGENVFIFISREKKRGDKHSTPKKFHLKWKIKKAQRKLPITILSLVILVVDSVVRQSAIALEWIR